MPGGNKDKPPIPTVPGNTTVTLTVDTVNINEINKNDSVTFTDNQSDPVRWLPVAWGFLRQTSPQASHRESFLGSVRPIDASCTLKSFP